MTVPRLTLLVIQHGLLARVEVAGSPLRITALQPSERPAQGTLADLIEAAARPGGKLRGPVWVLTDDVFVQVLKLNADAVRDLKDSELGQALAYEAQVVSGMGPAESALGWRGLRGAGRERDFQVVQMPRSDRERAQDAVRALGGRLAGIVHPAALPARLDAEGGGAGWGRLEIWRGLYAVVQDPDRTGLRASILPAAGARTLRAIAGAESATECLVASSAAEPADLEGLQVFRLSDDASLRWWLEAWAGVLDAAEPAVAAIRPEEKPVGAFRLVVLAVAIAALTMAACGWHAWTLRTRSGESAARLAAARAPAEELARLKADVAAKRAATVSPAALPRSDHLQRVLDHLAVHRPAGVVVTDLELAWDTGSIRGLSVNAGAVDSLAGSLSDALEPGGRSASTGPRTLNAAGLYSFEIRIGPAPQRASAAPRGER